MKPCCCGIILCLIFSGALCSYLEFTGDPQSKGYDDGEIGLSPLDYIRFKGYIAEGYWVTTPDGYILAVHRLRNPKFKGYLQPVLLIHGVLISSLIYLTGSRHGGTIRYEEYDYDTGKVKIVEKPTANLGFALADQGYDVWLPNCRGNSYSTNHTTLNPFKDSKFWDFTLEELSLIDLPTSIQFIQEKTGAKEMAYIGHSQGTLVGVWLLSERPEYSNILNPFILLAPVIEKRDIKHFPGSAVGKGVFSEVLSHHYGPVLGRSWLIDAVANESCSAHGVTTLCIDFVKLIALIDSPQFDSSRLPVISYYFPAGAGGKQFAHYVQVIGNSSLHYFDEGPLKNIEKYGNPYPPMVPINQLNSSTLAIFYSTDDIFAGPGDVKILKQSVRVKPIYVEKVPYDLFSHLDFVWGIHTGELINAQVIRLVNNYYGQRNSYSMGKT